VTTEVALFIVLSPNNPDPMYKQVTDQVRDAIASGDLKPNEKLPSIREMARALEISVITIKRAYLDLENEGYILTRAGLGSFVADVNRDSLREEKLREYRTELNRIVQTGRKFGVSTDDLIRLIVEIEED
jgi:GntR family transcriptional regulator